MTLPFASRTRGVLPLVSSCSGPPAVATLSSILGRKVGAAEVASGVFAAVRELEDESAEPLEEAEVRSDALSHARSFENELWTWRR